MKFYFSIQHKRLLRLFKSTGVNPIGGILLILAGFSAATYVLFANIEKASIIYLAIAISFLINLSKSKRNYFLKNCFSNQSFKKIRLVENSLIIIPFLIGALLFKAWLIMPILILSALLFSFIIFKNQFNFTLPTPYGKTPFEFTIGFRKSILVFVLSYVLAIVAISVNNFGIGAFAIAIQMLTLSFFYINSSEPNIYLWIYNTTSTQFIKHKIKTGLIQSLFLSLPLVFTLSILNPDFILINTAIFTLGLLYLTSAILFKYAYYPKLSMVQEMGFMMCLIMPPVLFIAIPILYNKANKNLKTYLQ